MKIIFFLGASTTVDAFVMLFGCESVANRIASPGLSRPVQPESWEKKYTALSLQLESEEDPTAPSSGRSARTT